jgi:hypothetical protein
MAGDPARCRINGGNPGGFLFQLIPLFRPEITNASGRPAIFHGDDVSPVTSAMTVIAKVPVNQRSASQRQRAERFEEFGCATCHRLSPGSLGLTEAGARLANLHLGCVDVQKVLSRSSTPQR